MKPCGCGHRLRPFRGRYVDVFAVGRETKQTAEALKSHAIILEL